ncbi:MAG: FAD-dependent oxidoreductase [Deltaproteobacteria bacterium]|nr:FAD-dependent oxidoreductase [Deltaproteobacteria bacterium]NIS77538.1 FAD-dependent oxidoreductase [Deltaproteobacteria bacterium]
MIRLTINDQLLHVDAGTRLLAAVEKLGIKVPTLCYHKALTPYGSCRLCVVEVHPPGGEPILKTSCSNQVTDGIKVFTDTGRVAAARKIVAELLLARSPDSDVVKRIASELGVTDTRVRKKYDDCVYCGLCVRMCEERMGRSAIGFSGRGPGKKLEPPFGKHNERCWVCGACDFICPVGKKVFSLTTETVPIPILNPYNMNLNDRPSVYILYPQAVPNKPVIDKDHCIHLNYEACGICKEVCEAEAIDFEQEDEKVEVNVGAVVLSPGFEVFDATRKEELGYGRYQNVVTALEFERILSPSGPSAGVVKRPSDGKVPDKIAFLQCVGSRDAESDYCSSVCCMYATKEAVIAKEHVGDNLQCDIFFMDIRAFGKGFETYFNMARELGVNYIRSRIPTVLENPESGNLMITYLDERDRKRSREYDMVVLSVGMRPPKTVSDIAQKFGLTLNEYDFCPTSPFNPVETGGDGIFVAGPLTEPKDIPETVMQASASASKVLSLLSDVRGSLILPREYPPEIDVGGQEPRVGVFVCHCGTNIAAVVSVPEAVEYARTLPNVVCAENFLYACSNDTQEMIKEKIEEHGLNRIVVAACTPRTHEPLFRNTLREKGLNPYLFEMANIRDQCSWVHMHEPERATRKSGDLIRIAVSKARLLEPLQKGSVKVIKSALVIGGGLSGMTAAMEIAGQGFPVFLIEKEEVLGGNLRHIHYMPGEENPADELSSLIARVMEHENVSVFSNAEVVHAEGSIGNFRTKIRHGEREEELEHGVIIIATGAKEYVPVEYLYGQDERVLTQVELEGKLASSDGAFLGTGGANGRGKTLTMIQCVGSRDEERPYCSRLCCMEAVKNALVVKQKSPGTSVYVLYRDVRTYGFRERFYTEARRKGVVFIRYDEERKPRVQKDGQGLYVKVYDQVLGLDLEIRSDLVVLSSGIVPHRGNEDIARQFKVPLNEKGFFHEAHMKLRPVDFATDGIFICGLAHSAKSVGESVIQAGAAGARAGSILSKDSIEMEANISHVIDENCDGCAYCIEPCPAQAITLIEYMWQGAVKKTVETNDSICKGCGSCMATCPKKGIFVRGFTLEQIGAQVDAALKSPK